MTCVCRLYNKVLLVLSLKWVANSKTMQALLPCRHSYRFVLGTVIVDFNDVHINSNSVGFHWNNTKRFELYILVIPVVFLLCAWHVYRIRQKFRQEKIFANFTSGHQWRKFSFCVHDMYSLWPSMWDDKKT